MYTNSFCTPSDLDIGGRGSHDIIKRLKFYLKVFVMGKALSGELSSRQTGIVMES